MADLLSRTKHETTKLNHFDHFAKLLRDANISQTKNNDTFISDRKKYVYMSTKNMHAKYNISHHSIPLVMMSIVS